MTRPILTLTTDFGLTDHFVGTMKGVILGICPAAQIVDISHGVTPFEIAEGAYLIAQAWRYFPKKTVHVVVVDPGVGSARRPILVEAGGQYFLGPDNGVLSMVYLHEKCKVRHIVNEEYFRHPVSRTFHGRDIFAPVGAHLAACGFQALLGGLSEMVDAGRVTIHLFEARRHRLENLRRDGCGGVVIEVEMLHVSSFYQ